MTMLERVAQLTRTSGGRRVAATSGRFYQRIHRVLFTYRSARVGAHVRYASLGGMLVPMVIAVVLTAWMAHGSWTGAAGLVIGATEPPTSAESTKKSSQTDLTRPPQAAARLARYQVKFSGFAPQHAVANADGEFLIAAPTAGRSYKAYIFAADHAPQEVRARAAKRPAGEKLKKPAGIGPAVRSRHTPCAVPLAKRAT